MQTRSFVQAFDLPGTSVVSATGSSGTDRAADSRQEKIRPDNVNHSLWQAG